ncbi:MAG: isochorismatase family protein [Mangrovibacterium sp.]
MRITKENTAALVIDLQEKLVPVMKGQEALLSQSKILIEGLQELGIPLIVTQQYSKGLGETVDPVRSAIKNFCPFEKRAFSCLDEETVMAALKKAEAKKVILCGIESHICVLQTAVDLKEAGYIPVVVMDCVSSRSRHSTDLATERFLHEGILMTSCESILFELTRSSKTPEFKAISKLLK